VTFTPRKWRRQWLYSRLREVSESFGYQEFEGPFLESMELYAAKRGDELVKEQCYVFPDRGGDLITLRPELTPSLVRMIAQRQNGLVYPLRWWSWGPMWRYERPQKGRTREFFQWNVDLIGAATPEGDAELAAVIATFFRSVGLQPQHATVRINNRRLLDASFRPSTFLKCGGMFPALSTGGTRCSHPEWELMPAGGLEPAQLNGLKGMLDNSELWRKSDELKLLCSSGYFGRQATCTTTSRSCAGWITTPARCSKPGLLPASGAPSWRGPLR
jgi:histidyl-tRNA synthetase